MDDETYIAQAQRLLWKAEQLRDLGAEQARRRVLCELAEIHRTLALQRLERGDPDGWIDLYAAVTAFAEAGEKGQARTLVGDGRKRATRLPADAQENVARELDAHARWLEDLLVLPGLSETFAWPVPPPTLHGPVS